MDDGIKETRMSLWQFERLPNPPDGAYELSLMVGVGDGGWAIKRHRYDGIKELREGVDRIEAAKQSGKLEVYSALVMPLHYYGDNT